MYIVVECFYLNDTYECDADRKVSAWAETYDKACIEARNIAVKSAVRCDYFEIYKCGDRNRMLYMGRIER